MPKRRQVQVADAVQQYMSELIQRELKDPRIGFATVTRVEMSQDLRFARIFISVMGTPEEQKSTMAALESGKGFIRREIGSRLDLRFAPEIQFKLDTSAEYSERIARLLNELKQEEEIRQESSGTNSGQASGQSQSQAEAGSSSQEESL